MKFYSFFSIGQIYNSLKLAGTFTFVWPVVWNSKNFRIMTEIIHYLVLIFYFIIVIPFIIFARHTINGTESFTATAIELMVALETAFSILYCKLKQNQYKV